MHDAFLKRITYIPKKDNYKYISDEGVRKNKTYDELFHILKNCGVPSPVGLLEEVKIRDTPVPTTAGLWEAGVAIEPKEFVSNWLDAKGFNGEKIGSISEEDLCDLSLTGYAYLRNFPKNQRPFEPGELTISLNALTSANRKLGVCKTLEDLEYNPESDPSVIEKMVKLIMSPAQIGKPVVVDGRSIGYTYDEIYTAILTHYIWQVQRRVRKLPAYMEMAIIFYGGQNLGKNKFISSICSPWKSMFASLSLDSLLDDALGYRLGYTSILYSDELSGMRKTAVEVLKERITSTSVTYRVLYTKRDVKGDNLASLLGSSNHQLSNVLRDDTGMRRWSQIDCTRHGGHLDMLPQEAHQWAMENAREMWTSVDYEGGSILSKDINPGLFCAVREYQESFRSNSPVESFLVERGWYPIINDNRTRVEIDSLFRMWNVYRKNTGDRHLPLKSFMVKLGELGVCPCGDGNKYVTLAETRDETSDSEEIGI